MKTLRTGTALAAAVLLGLAVVAMIDSASTPAVAGEMCRKPVSAVGRSVRGESNARNSAIAAWQRATAKKYGRRFADYTYSGDRSFACTWDARGINYRCGVTALPCG